MFDVYLTKAKVEINKFIRKHNDDLSKIIIIIIITLICFIPTYIGILIWWLVSPVGFWQIFTTMALLLVVFGSTQAVAAFFGIFAIISVLIE